MPANRSFPTVFFTYLAIVVGVMWWSGSITDRSIYDKYIVRFEGQVLPSRNLERSLGFYSRVMDFRAIHQQSPTAAYLQLPEKKKIFFKLLAAGDPLEKSEVVLKVRNGFDRLFEILRQRITDALAKDSTIGSISEISQRTNGKEFIVSDPDGNRLVFFQPFRQSLTRD